MKVKVLLACVAAVCMCVCVYTTSSANQLWSIGSSVDFCIDGYKNYDDYEKMTKLTMN